MQENSRDEFIENLTLALIYLSSWKEKALDAEVHRAWKGYDFALLDRLKEAGLIHFSNTAKSLYLTDEGVKKAEEVVRRLRGS